MSSREASGDATKASLLESHFQQLDEIATLRRSFLRDLYFTIQSQRKPSTAIHLSSLPDEDDEFSGQEDFLKQWDVADDRHFKSIEELDAGSGSPVISQPATPTRMSSSPDPLALGDADDSMQIDVPDKSYVSRNEEAQVDATLDMTKYESEEEDQVPVVPEEVLEEDADLPDPPAPEPVEDIVLEAEVVPASPPRPATPSAESSSLSDVEPQKAAVEEEDEPMTPIEQTGDHDTYIESHSPLARTFSNIVTSPHYRHSSPMPAAPSDPDYGELAIDPQATMFKPAYDPLVTEYALSLYPLPPPTAPIKKRKKDKERNSKGLEIYRQQASIATNPVSRFFAKTTKCLSSKEWAVGFAERRFVRAMHQIEQLKAKGRWSFRQPKRSKGPTLAKVHWDYVLDEMRWLQADFREERRWKLAVAFELVHAVADWHRADPEERADMCVKWKAPTPEEIAKMSAAKVPGDATAPVEVRDEPEDDAEDHEETVNNAEELHLDDAEEDPAPEAVDGAGMDVSMVDATDAMKDLQKGVQEPEIKEEAEVVDLSAFRAAASVDVEEADAEGDAEQDDVEGEGEDFKQSLLGLIQDPFESAQPGDQTEVQEVDGANSKTQAMKALRAPLLQTLSATDTVLDLSKLASNLSLNAPVDSSNALREHQAIQLPDLFPELAPFGPFLSDAESKGRPEKRIEETNTLGRIAYVSRLLDIQPVLVSTLQPAQKWRNGEWDDLAEYYPGNDTNQELKPSEFYLPAPPPIFSGQKKPREYPVTRGASHHFTPEQAQHRFLTQTWTSEEDEKLKHLAYLYSLNWNIIADSFNSWRKSTPTDRRTEWDCMVRWDRQFGPTAKSLAAQQAQQQQDQMAIDDNAPIGSRRTTRNIPSRYKEPPQTASVQMMPPPGQAANTPIKLSDLTKKQIHRGYLHEAIKRIAKKREIAVTKAAANNQIKSRAINNIHETHNLSGHQFSVTDLAQIKMDRERKALQTLNYRKHDELRRALQGQQAAPGTPTAGPAKLPVSAPLAAGQVAQIRNMNIAAAQQAQMQRTQSSGGSSQPAVPGTPTPPMSRVPTVTQQAMLAQAQSQHSQVQAQLAAAQQVANMQTQSTPPRPDSSASAHSSSPQQSLAATQQQASILRAQQFNMGGFQPFDPSMMSGLPPEQVQAILQRQQQLQLMMAQQNQGMNHQVRTAQPQMPVATAGTPSQSSSSPTQMSPG